VTVLTRFVHMIEMGGSGAILKPSESVEAILTLVTRSTPEVSGKFYRYDGEEIPW
jgi:hypothetical protein